jgi:hypothetical protein
MSKDPAPKAEQKLVHHQAFYRERRKTKESRHRHFKDLPILPHRKDVQPLGAGPVVPELPEDSTHKSGTEVGVKPACFTLFQVTQQGAPSPGIIDGVEYQDEPYPNCPEQITSHAWRREQGKGKACQAEEKRDDVPERAKGISGFPFISTQTQRQNEVRGLEDGGPDGCK